MRKAEELGQLVQVLVTVIRVMKEEEGLHRDDLGLPGVNGLLDHASHPFNGDTLVHHAAGVGLD